MILDKLSQVFREAEQLPGFMSVAVFDATGNVVAKHQSDANVNVVLEGAYQVEIIKQAKLFLTMSEVNQGNELGVISVETLKYTYYLISSESGSMYFVLMLDAKRVNVGMTRILIEKQRDALRGSF